MNTLNYLQRVSPIDENHVLYGNYIGLQYCFEHDLDADALKTAIGILQDQFPALAGVYHAGSHAIKLATSQSLELHIRDSEQSTIEYLASLKPSQSRDHRARYIIEPARADVIAGRAQMSSYCLTRLRGGGSVLGIAISHVLTDAAGFHTMMQHLAGIYTAVQNGKPVLPAPFVTSLPAFEFGTDRSKAQCLAALNARGLPKPIPITGGLGWIIKRMIIRAMDKSLSRNPAIRVTLTAEQVVQLKNTVHAESGQDWVSTNMALCAHLTRIMAQLSYSSDLKYDMQIGQLVDLRGRYFETDANAQSRFVGNAILIHIDNAHFPDGLQKTSRADLARYFKARQARMDAADIESRLDDLSDCLRHGYTNPELDVKNPIISINNQSKLPVYAVQFDGHTPRHIVPQDVGDNVMIFPSKQGGVDIYIRDIVNPGRQSELRQPVWQAQLYDI